MSEALFKKTRIIVRELIPFMSEKSIPITPRNYQIFYEYFSGDKPGLSKKVGDLIQQGCCFDDTMLEELYQQLYALDFGNQELEKVKKELEIAGKVSAKTNQLMQEAIQDIKSGTETASKYGAALEAGSSGLATASGDGKLRQIVEKLTTETLETKKANESVHKKLEESHQNLQNLNDELKAARAEARTDTLTQLNNRRSFQEDMADAMALASIGGKCSIILLDIDFFKRFNDTYGHQIGDKVLEQVADQLRFRDNDKIRSYRYGGEEFALLCYGLDINEGYKLAERVRKNVAAIGFTVRGEEVPLTISLGVANIEEDRKPEDALKFADDAMYLAKESGRNCTRTETDIPKG